MTSLQHLKSCYAVKLHTLNSIKNLILNFLKIIFCCEDKIVLDMHKHSCLNTHQVTTMGQTPRNGVNLESGSICPYDFANAALGCLGELEGSGQHSTVFSGCASLILESLFLFCLPCFYHSQESPFRVSLRTVQ